MKPQSKATKPPKVCVFLGASDSVDDIFKQAAHTLGTLLVKEKIICINGAGNTGLMRCLNDSILENEGTTEGVIPSFMVDNRWAYERIPQLHITPDMHQRKQTMYALADAFIILPGGIGTMEEFMEILTWKQLKLHQKPIILINIAGIYDHFLKHLQLLIDKNFMQKQDYHLFHCVSTPQEAITTLRSLTTT